jgi:gluconokinase
VRDELASGEAEDGRRLGKDPYDHLTELASQAPVGSGGLIFLPLLAGERAPYWNANARGVFFGLALHHHKPHMIRAVLEGVAYRIHSVTTALEELIGPAQEIRASGGFARSSFWLQIMSDVLAAPLTVPESIESSGLGAAMLGLLAMGEISDLSGIHDWIKTGVTHLPNGEHALVYAELTDIYLRVYHQLKDEFDAISAFQSKYQ